MRNLATRLPSAARPSLRGSLVLAVVALGGLVTAGPAAAPTIPDATTSTQATISGDTVYFAGLSVAIPARGKGVTASALMLDGDFDLTVERSATGVVSVRTEAHGADEGTAQAASPAGVPLATAPSACVDGGYALSGWKVPSFAWYYNPAGIQAGLTATAGAAVGNATASLSTACGKARVNLSPVYAGRTTAAPQVSAAGACTGNDHRNVLGWRAGTGRWLGMTCTYYTQTGGRKIVAGTDTALNTQYKFFTSVPSGCRSAYDLQSVVLHERGHSLGLNHVDQSAHASAVMTPALTACSTKRAMNLGDYKGLAAIYGTR